MSDNIINENNIDIYKEYLEFKKNINKQQKESYSRSLIIKYGLVVIWSCIIGRLPRQTIPVELLLYSVGVMIVVIANAVENFIEDYIAHKNIKAFEIKYPEFKTTASDEEIKVLIKDYENEAKKRANEVRSIEEIKTIIEFNRKIENLNPEDEELFNSIKEKEEMIATLEEIKRIIITYYYEPQEQDDETQERVQQKSIGTL